jgi:hypothetical protein
MTAAAAAARQTSVSWPAAASCTVRPGRIVGQRDTAAPAVIAARATVSQLKRRG